MKSKALISSLIVVTIIVGLVIMFTSGPSNTDSLQQVNVVEEKQPLVGKQSDVEQQPLTKKASATDKSEPKAAKKPKPIPKPKTSSRNEVATVTPDKSSSNRITRVSRPGQKFRMVRVETRSIPPQSEFRNWSRDKWVTKVSALQREGEHSLAQEYIAAYNTQYPEKDLNNYLK